MGQWVYTPSYIFIPKDTGGIRGLLWRWDIISYRLFADAVLLGRTAAVRKVDGGRNRHCDVIIDAPLYLDLTLMLSNVGYASIFYAC